VIRQGVDANFHGLGMPGRRGRAKTPRSAERYFGFLPQRAAAAALAWAVRSSGVWEANRSLVARRAFLAEAAAFLAVLMLPRATAALFLRVIVRKHTPKKGD